MSKGDLGYFTIPIRDLKRGRTFYGGLLGWEFLKEASSDSYAHIGNTNPPGGLYVNDETTPKVWFKVEDIKAAVARVRELGGHAEEPQHSDSGWNSACRDDQGTQFNLWEPAPGY
jgi:uncharacterized protein